MNTCGSFVRSPFKRAINVNCTASLRVLPVLSE